MISFLLIAFNDTPANFNAHLQQNVPVFQIAQDIPLPKFNYTTGAGGPAPENVSCLRYEFEGMKL